MCACACACTNSCACACACSYTCLLYPSRTTELLSCCQCSRLQLLRHSLVAACPFVDLERPVVAPVESLVGPGATRESCLASIVQERCKIWVRAEYSSLQSKWHVIRQYDAIRLGARQHTIECQSAPNSEKHRTPEYLKLLT